MLFFNSAMPSPLAGSTTSAFGQIMYAAILFAVAASGWIFGGNRPALVFSEAEVQLLFPAPLSRGALVRYKVAQAQLVVLLSVIVWVILLRHGGTPLPFWMRAISLWIILSTLYMHRIGASLVRTSAAASGARGVRRNFIPIAVITIAVGLAAWSVVRALPTIRVAMLLGSGNEALERLSASQPLATVLYPFRLLVAPLFAETPGHWLRAVLPAFALLLVHYPWVAHTDAAFEEAAAEAAARRTRVRASMRGRSRLAAPPADGHVARPWFPLAPTGHPAIAIIWKNVLAYTRTLRLATFVILLAGVAVIGGALYSEVSDVGELAAIAQILTGIPLLMLVLLGPGFVRADLRQDLLQLDQLRSYPLRGWAVVAAEIAGTTLILTAMQYALLALGVLLASYDPNTPVPVVPAALIALIALPIVNAITVTIANGMALLFPGWARLGDGRATGVEAMGQNVLALSVSLIVTMVALILPMLAALLVAGVAGASPRHAPNAWAFVAAAPAGALVACGELWLVLRWLGRVFARTDLAQIETAA
jgi:ABC-2 type transport system permease protein